MFDRCGRFGFLAFALLLAGCAEPPPPQVQMVSPVSVIGTPFLIAFKVPACIATVVLAGPATALQQMAAPTQDGLQPDLRPVFEAGIDQNCGPPYYVVPR
jgi:hypothetical protein